MRRYKIISKVGPRWQTSRVGKGELDHTLLPCSLVCRSLQRDHHCPVRFGAGWISQSAAQALKANHFNFPIQDSETEALHIKTWMLLTPFFSTCLTFYIILLMYTVYGDDGKTQIR